MSTIKLLIVEDQPFFRELLEKAIANVPQLDVVGTVEDGEGAVEMARKKKPDAVLMDIVLAGELNGIQAGLKIKEERPETAIVLLSSHMERGYLTSLPLNHSCGWAYLLKQTLSDLDTVVRTIEGSLRGMVVLDPMIASNLLPREGSLLQRLSERQVDVLRLIAQGYNNNAIATELFLTQSTVETYINGIYQELEISREPGVHSRVRATIIYLEESRLDQM